MRLSGSDLKLLWDMRRAAEQAIAFTRNKTLESFRTDELCRRATERVVQIIGEAAYHVSDDARNLLPDVMWGAIVATRHILVHDYEDVDHEKIWRIATQHMHELLRQIDPVLAANPPGPDAAKPLDET